MIKLLQIFILIGIFSFSVFSQEEKVKEIRKIYTDIANQIERAKDKEDLGGLYSNEVIVNSNNTSWRAVGNYKNHVKFWYSDEPEMAQQIDGSSLTSVLKKITLNQESAIRNYYYEYVFDNDQLVFYYEVEKPGFDGNIENRYYFNDGKLIKYMEGADVKKYDGDFSNIFTLVEAYKKMFLATF